MVAIKTMLRFGTRHLLSSKVAKLKETLRNHLGLHNWRHDNDPPSGLTTLLTAWLAWPCINPCLRLHWDHDDALDLFDMPACTWHRLSDVWLLFPSTGFFRPFRPGYLIRDDSISYWYGVKVETGDWPLGISEYLILCKPLIWPCLTCPQHPRLDTWLAMTGSSHRLRACHHLGLNTNAFYLAWVDTVLFQKKKIRIRPTHFLFFLKICIW